MEKGTIYRVAEKVSIAFICMFSGFFLYSAVTKYLEASNDTSIPATQVTKDAQRYLYELNEQNSISLEPTDIKDLPLIEPKPSTPIKSETSSNQPRQKQSRKKTVHHPSHRSSSKAYPQKNKRKNVRLSTPSIIVKSSSTSSIVTNSTSSSATEN